MLVDTLHMKLSLADTVLFIYGEVFASGDGSPRVWHCPQGNQITATVIKIITFVLRVYVLRRLQKNPFWKTDSRPVKAGDSLFFFKAKGPPLVLFLSHMNPV